MAGVISLLVGKEGIPASNLWVLSSGLPYLLVALGAGLILCSRWRPFGRVVPGLVGLGAAALVIVATQMGWDRTPKAQWTIKDLRAGLRSGSGKIVAQTRLPGEFDAITIGYPGTVIIRQSDKNYVTVEADDNLLPQLATRVEDGILLIENEEDQYFHRVVPTQTVVITIHVKDLRQIVTVGEGRSEVNGLKTDDFLLSQKCNVDAVLTGLDVGSLRVNMSEGGKVTSTGQAHQLFLSIAKKGEFDGTDMQTQVVQMSISGTATATTRVKDEIQASLNGRVTVNYYGLPSIIRESITGVASINKVDE